MDTESVQRVFQEWTTTNIGGNQQLLIFIQGDVLGINAERGINVNAMELKNTINVTRFSQDASWPGMVELGPKLPKLSSE